MKASRIILCLVIMLFLYATCWASGTHKVVMVVLPGTSLNDLTGDNLPNIKKLMDMGAIGLMNSRTAGRLDMEPNSFIDPRYTPESGYVTLGAGTRAIAGIDARKAFNRLEITEGVPAYEVLARRTLVKPDNSEVVHPGIAKIRYDNSNLNFEVIVGLLGSAIHDAGLKTAVVGNSDAESIHREVATICMDNNGLVDFGNVESAMAMDDRRLLDEAARCIESADFTVIELGDTARLDRARLDIMDEVFQKERVEILKKTDQALGRLLALVNLKNSILVVLSPYPPSYTLEQTQNSLCPILAAGAGIRHGLLISGSTQIPGVIANTDIAPTIIDWLGVSAPTALVGRTIASTPHPSPVNALQKLNARASMQALSQPLLRQVMAAVIVLIGIITALWLIIPHGHTLRRKLLPALVLLPPALAPAMLLMGLFAVENRVVMLLGISLLTIALTAIAIAVARKPLKALMLIALTFTALVAIDLISGGTLCRYSIMGYSIIDGSRYYGIGNEFTGAVIGAGLIGIGLLLNLMDAGRKTAYVILLCGLILGAVLIGSPTLGANTGGAIAVITAFGFALAAMSKKPLDYWRMAGIVLGLIIVLAIFAFLDSLRGQEHESHLGKTVRLVFMGGLGQIGILIKRKLLMNLLLIRVSIWSRLLVAYLISTAVALYSEDAISRLRPLPPYLRVALAGTMSGAFAVLIFNDSGIVAAGTCFVYAWALVLLMAVDTNKSTS